MVAKMKLFMCENITKIETTTADDEDSDVEDLPPRVKEFRYLDETGETRSLKPTVGTSPRKNAVPACFIPVADRSFPEGFWSPRKTHDDEVNASVETVFEILTKLDEQDVDSSAETLLRVSEDETMEPVSPGELNCQVNSSDSGVKNHETRDNVRGKFPSD